MLPRWSQCSRISWMRPRLKYEGWSPATSSRGREWRAARRVSSTGTSARRTWRGSSCRIQRGLGARFRSGTFSGTSPARQTQARASASRSCLGPPRRCRGRRCRRMARAASPRSRFQTEVSPPPRTPSSLRSACYPSSCRGTGRRRRRAATRSAAARVLRRRLPSTASPHPSSRHGSWTSSAAKAATRTWKAALETARTTLLPRTASPPM
mmetsp:Transcript_81709/g.239878  ORF Transcript_81709/g.239878 Transcript_81709/m.239878 type:complete len:210 (+) Transcript_81709:550-1179(+)